MLYLKIIYCFFLITIFNPKSGYSQKINTDLIKAKKLITENKYEEAISLFQKIYKKEKTSKIYKPYLECLKKKYEYEKAIKLVKAHYNKHGKNPSLLIDLGEIYMLKGEEKSGEKEFQKAIDEIKLNPRFSGTVASNFYSKKQYEFSLKAYLIAKENFPNQNYSFQISNIYSNLGQIENMYSELIELLYRSPGYMQNCKSRIGRTINDDPENENNIILKKSIIKELQKKENEILNDLLIWVYLQEKNFEKAIQNTISIDKRIDYQETKIFELGEIAISNKEFEVAKKAFNYLISKTKNGIYYEESILQLNNIKNLQFNSLPIKLNSDIKKIIDDNENVIVQLGVKNETIVVIKNLANIIAFYEMNFEKAKNLLMPVIENKNLNEKKIATLKMELGDILLSEGKKWDAILYYSQVEKKFKNDIVGQEAKFKKIKVDYYNGDFNWAQTQLDILKKSTSKLVSNNSIELSLLITDNLNLDTTKTALEKFAKAELYIFQNNYKKANSIFEDIENTFPDHSLIDEILFKKAEIEIKEKKYEKALSFLEQIVSKYGNESILYDDALFKQAYIFEDILNKKDNAMEKYKAILIEQPGSIFLAESRKRYRNLRNK